MRITLVNPSKSNPNRPPKYWFDKKVAEMKKRGYKDPRKLVGHLWYHIASPTRKAEILRHEKSSKKSPASISRGFINPFKERSMYSLTRKRRVTRKAARRRNPKAKRGMYAGRMAPRSGTHRPRLQYVPALGWRRPKHSRLFPKPTRLNPRKRRKVSRRRRYNPVATVATNPRRSRRHIRHHARRTRRNPKLPFGIDKVAIAAAKIAGGLVLGMIGLPIIGKLATMASPTAAVTYRKFFGLAHVVIGAVAIASVKNKDVKEAAMTFAAVGIYDLVSQNLTFLGLPLLGGFTGALAFVNGDEPGVVGMGSTYQQVGADFEPAFGSSYQYAGSDDISYGGDSIELD